MKKIVAIVIFAVAMSLAGQSQAFARTKFYKTNTNLPFVEMMLNMMVVMGILDKIPPYLLSGYPASPYAYPYTRYNTINNYPLSRLGLRGLNTNNRYSQYRDLRHSPLYRNPLLGFPDTSYSPFKNSYYRGYGFRDESEPESAWLPMKPSSCNGGSCDVRETGLNGLWVSDDGEMLGIRNDQFLWTNGKDKHITGLMVVTPDRVVANIDGSDEQISYEYIVRGDTLVTRDRGGTIRNFWRAQSAPSYY